MSDDRIRAAGSVARSVRHPRGMTGSELASAACRAVEHRQLPLSRQMRSHGSADGAKPDECDNHDESLSIWAETAAAT